MLDRIQRRILVNGLEVEASYSKYAVETHFLPFLRHCILLQQEKQGRIFVFLTAPAGYGKSTLIEFLVYLAETEEKNHSFQPLGIDGFHFYQGELEKKGLLGEKGSSRTFDTGKLFEKLRELQQEATVTSFPKYDRVTHNPQEDAISVIKEKKIILLEGNYLSSPLPQWKKLVEFKDLGLFLTAPEPFLKERILARKQQSGKSYEEALDFYEKSDRKNILEVLNCDAGSDLRWDYRDIFTDTPDSKGDKT